MAASSVSKPSLDRLKALNGLPDLNTQLHEAEQLCTHSARADMILRWLLDQLKKNASTRALPRAWNLLGSACRLLSAEAIARLLSAHDFLDSVEKSLTDAATQWDVLAAINASLRLLMGLSEGSDGASLKAFLSVDASKAASFVGAWFETVSVHASADLETAQIVVESGLVEPGIQIWKQRKRHAEEDAYLASSCLVPAASLLTLFQSSHKRSLLKRRRASSTNNTASGFVSALETIFARHAFLPTRTALMASSGRSTKHRADVDAAALLRQRLSSLVDVRLANAESAITYETVLPALLDVGLRCGSVTTPRRRLMERPWVELLFESLLACAQAADQVRVRATLVSMLSVMKGRSTLSLESLSRLTKSFAVSGTNKLDWQIIAKVIEIDPKVYLDVAKTSELFNTISTTMSDSQKGKNTATTDAQHIGLYAMLQQAIIIPVMHAYANSRNLVGFIDLWQSQLERIPSSASEPIWADLDGAFSPLVGSMTEAQVVDLVQRFSLQIRAAITKSASNESIIHTDVLQSSIVLLQAIVRGLRSDELPKVLHDELAFILDSLLSAQKSHADTHRHIWSLLRTASERWFPRWAAAPLRTTDEISKKCVAWLECARVQVAAEHLQCTTTSTEPDVQHEDSINCMELFLASLCNICRSYSSCETPGAGVLESILRSQQSPALIIYPNLLPLAIEIKPSQVEVWMRKAAADHAKGMSLADSSDYLDAIAATAEDGCQPRVIQKLLEGALSFLASAAHEPNAMAAQRLIAIRVLSSLRALDSTQRERILMVMLTEETASAGLTSILVPQQLSMMLQHFEMTEGLLELFSRPEVIRKLLSMAHTATESNKEAADTGSDAEALGSVINELLQRLLVKVVVSLVAPQYQQSSRKTLLVLAGEVKRHIKSSKAAKRLIQEQPGELLLVKTVTEVVEKATDLIDKEKLPYRQPACLSAYLDALLDSLGYTEDATAAFGFTGTRQQAFRYIDALLSTPRQLLLSLGLGQNLDRITAAVEVTLGYAQDLLADSDESSQFSEEVKANLPTILRCFRTASEDSYFPTDWFNNGGSLASLAKDLLSLDLQPCDHDQVLKSFTSATQKLGASSRAAVIDDLTSGGADTTKVEMVLLQHAITVLVKDDVPTPEWARGLVSRLLHITENMLAISVRREAISCLATVLKNSFLATQSVLERVITTMSIVLNERGDSARLFPDLCGLITVLLNHHRSRLSDRLNVMVPLLQAIISSLFNTPVPRSSTEAQSERLVTNARLLARLLQLLCSPPHHQHRSHQSGLVDEARKMQAHVGQHVQYVLHYYCRRTLQSVPGEGVREALLPGLWAIIEAVETNDTEGVKVLSAAMNNSERAVLRRLYDEYKAVGKWRGA